MATNKIVLQTADEFMADFQPVYAPLFGLFLGNSTSYASEVGKVDFKRLTTIGDVEGKHYGPKETEIKQISVGEYKKTFNKYFFGREYVQSTLQNEDGNSDIIGQVLEAQTKHQDKLLCYGDGTSALDIQNNALLYSNDPNYVLDSATNKFATLAALHADVMSQYDNIMGMEGRKHILFYGPGVRPAFNGVYTTSNLAFKKVLSDSLGADVTMSAISPELANTSAVNGFLIVNFDLIKLHYTILPQLFAQGVDERASETWHKFLYGSMMLEVKREGAIVHRSIDWQ